MQRGQGKLEGVMSLLRFFLSRSLFWPRWFGMRLLFVVPVLSEAAEAAAEAAELEAGLSGSK